LQLDAFDAFFFEQPLHKRAWQLGDRKLELLPHSAPQILLRYRYYFSVHQVNTNDANFRSLSGNIRLFDDSI
jgi:hypothetical protein